MEKYKSIPQFENEEQERAFWAENDSAEYVEMIKIFLKEKIDQEFSRIA